MVEAIGLYLCRRTALSRRRVLRGAARRVRSDIKRVAFALPGAELRGFDVQEACALPRRNEQPSALDLWGGSTKMKITVL